MSNDQTDYCAVNKQNRPVSQGSQVVDCLVDVVHSKLENDLQVREHLARNKIRQLVKYLFSSSSKGKSMFPLGAMKKYITAQVGSYRTAHSKSATKAAMAMNTGDQCMASADYNSAIECYSKAICSVPHSLDKLETDCRLAELYGKRSVCLYMANSTAAAEFDFKTCSRLDAVTGLQCLQKVVELLSSIGPDKISPQVRQSLSQMITQQQTNLNLPAASQGQSAALIKSSGFEPNVIFDPKLLSLWFNNRAKGSRHPAGAHFLCAKTNLEAGTKVLEEKPLVSVCGQLHSTCAGCARMVGLSFWPCDTCDEAVFCGVECFNSCLHHKTECGLASFVRSSLSPLATILLHLYIRSQCLPEYSAKSDLVKRASLSTDADLHFAGRANPAKLPKRSYQYRYFLLANSTAKKNFSSLHRLISTEALLAVRESADNKDEVLPAIVHNKLSTVLLESILVLLVLELATGNVPDNLQDRLVAIIEDYQRLYRLNSGQGLQDSDTGITYFVQPIVGAFFWPDCQPNVQVTYCSAKDCLAYHTTKPVQQFDKLVVAFPVDYLAHQDSAVNACPCLSCVQAAERTSVKVVNHQGKITPINVPKLPNLAGASI